MPAALSADVQAALDTFKRGVEAIYGQRLKGLILYGSRARGDARSHSDIDVAVILNAPVDIGEEIRRTSDLRAHIHLDTELLVSSISSPRISFQRKINSPLLLKHSREGRPL